MIDGPEGILDNGDGDMVNEGMVSDADSKWR